MAINEKKKKEKNLLSFFQLLRSSHVLFRRRRRRRRRGAAAVGYNRRIKHTDIPFFLSPPFSFPLCVSDINRTETFIFNCPLPSPHVVVLRFVLLLCTSSLSSSSPPSSSSSPLCSRTRTHVHKSTYDFVVVSQSLLHGRTETTGCCCRRCHRNVSHGNGAVDRIHRRLVINIQIDVKR